ncbi:MAG: hypothetical protein ACK4HC_06425 [Cloacibacterium sp.]
MEFKGTKGKWRVFTNVHRECDGSEWGWVGLDTFNSKSINKCSIHWSGDEAKANALLISKAPEMLEMLKRISYNLKNEECPFDDFEIDTLIKEATEL